MRLLLLFAALLVVAGASRSRRSSIYQEVRRLADKHPSWHLPKTLFRLWENFKSRHSKEYESFEAEVSRLEIFVENLLFIEHHNKEYDHGRKKHKTRVNQFADMTSEEFVKTMNGFKRSYGDSLAKGHGAAYVSPQNFQLPTEVDWRKKGYVTPVKNQGHCGSCWSFSSTGALEGQHFRKTGKLVSLSEQNLVDCSTDYGNNGCEGGLMDQAFQYIKDNGGIDTEQSYPYEAEDARCRFNRTNIGAKDKGFVDIPSENVTALMEAIASVGPVSVAIDASHRSFQFYSEGVYVEPQCSQTDLDHGVLTVGYGTEHKHNEDSDYWIIKNSWGTTWGVDGYVKMARQGNQCGVATQASYPLV